MNPKSFWSCVALIVFGLAIYFLSPILIPFLIAFVLAYLTDPIVNRLVNIKIPRTLAVVIVFCGLFGIIITLIILLIPLLEKQIVILINKIPAVLMWIQQNAMPWLEEHFGINEVLNVDGVKNFLSQHWQEASSVATSIWRTAFYSGYTLFIVLFDLVMIPVVTFYLLRDWEKIVSGTQALFPRDSEALALKLLSQCDEVLGAFFRGQFLVMLILGVYYVFALWLVGVELALLIGIITGLISLVPYLGFIVGIIFAVIATLVQYHDWIPVLWVVLVFGIGSLLENMVLAPLLVGDRIGLHPVAVIFAILAGGQLFGFTGVLIALPVAALIMVLVRHLKERYLDSQMYNAKKT